MICGRGSSGISSASVSITLRWAGVSLTGTATSRVTSRSPLRPLPLMPRPRTRSVRPLDVPAGTWAVFRSEGPHPQALQDVWARTATEWFPSNRWRLRPGPEVLAVLEEDRHAATATCELWLPVEAG